MSLYRQKKRSSKHNKNLNQDDVIAFLNKYFTDFEDNLRDNNFEKMDTQLIENIISKFDKIFHLWDENRIFQKSIDENYIEKNYFKKIHESMLNTFGTSNENRNDESVNDNTNKFTLECNDCGEAFPLRNKDCQYSYELHTTSDEHKEFVRNLELNHDDSDTSSDPDTPDEELISDTETVVDAYEQLFIYARCNLCYHRIAFGNLDYKTHESVVAKSIMVHLKSKYHRYQAGVFRKNKRYIEEGNLGKNEFRCKPCQEDLYLDKLVDHFKTKEHEDKLLCENGTIPGTDIIEKDQDLPLLQPLRNPTRNPAVIKSRNYDKKLASEMEKLCIGGEKNSEVSSVAENCIQKLNKNQIPVPLGKNLISVFDASCIVLKDDVLLCKICRVKPLICHMKGKKHLKMAKLYGSFGQFIEEKDDMVQCTLCNYGCKAYQTFFKHCRSNKNHLEKVKQSSESEQPNFIVRWEAAEVIQCPVVECSSTVSEIECLFSHLKSVHEIK